MSHLLAPKHSCACRRKSGIILPWGFVTGWKASEAQARKHIGTIVSRGVFKIKVPLDKVGSPIKGLHIYERDHEGTLGKDLS
jgi:hypothetical protein